MIALLVAGQRSDAAPAANVSASEVAKMEAEAKRVSKEHQQMEQKANKLKEELKNVNQKMIAAAKKIQNGEDELRKKQEELEVLQKHLNESEEKFNSENDMLIETLAALQNLALRPSEAVLVQPLSPVEVMRSSILLRGSVHALESRASSIRQSIEDISNQKKQIASRLQDLEKDNKILAQQQEDMKKLSQQKSTMYSQISSKSEEAKKKADMLASQAHNLRDLLEKLEKQKEIARRQMAEKARLAREQAADKMRKENHGLEVSYEAENSVTVPETPVTGFSKAKGRLSRPARGPLVTAFHSELSKGVVSNGIDIKTAAKAQVIAPFDGTVIYAGPFKNFANLVIIDHGEGYTSLLSGLGETDTEVGQSLLAGEPVGTMPADTNSKLHMEIRKNNHPVDPNEWIKK
ncbi:MAG: peptidoglycan DD-metalloendopeptidase family protein [Alphaproteobacteria bacterium]|nr:peptidoglycan DD-metalloendopeptidase family protein [Alphaproteobacteria bacterium]